MSAINRITHSSVCDSMTMHEHPRRNPSGHWKSDCTIDIPQIDIVSYAFGRLSELDQHKALFIDARDPSKYITAYQAQHTILQLATGFRKHGLQTGDCVCIHSYNSILYPLLWLGTIAAGGIVTGSNPASTSQELLHHLQNTNTKFIVSHAGCLPTIHEAASKHGILASNIFIIESGEHVVNPGFRSWTILQDSGGIDDGAVTAPYCRSSHDAVYAATSGTTGLPKAAVITHRYMVAQAILLEHLFERQKDIKQLHCLPVFHTFASQLALILPLRLGIPTYILPRFKLDDYVKAVEEHQITDAAVVPPIITALTNMPKAEYVRIQSLRCVISAGAPMGSVVQSSFNHILHSDATVSQCWGTTELGWVSVFSRHERDTTASVGRLLPNISLKIVGEDGKIVTKDGVLGEACVRSASMFSGYRGKNLSDYEPCDKEGYYHTGDRVYFEKGKLYIQGRIKDTMKVNGWQVSPEEIQDVIMQLKPRGVVDCAVKGVESLRDGLQETRPCAFVIRDSSKTITEEDIKQYVAENLIAYKRLSGGVVFVESIPRSATGKILRRLL